jgi:hypothetical protein
MALLKISSTIAASSSELKFSVSRTFIAYASHSLPQPPIVRLYTACHKRTHPASLASSSSE